MGLFTGIDWWNSRSKQSPALWRIIRFSTLPQQLSVPAQDMASASQVVNRAYIEGHSSMGIGMDDLLKMADEIEAAGETSTG